VTAVLAAHRGGVGMVAGPAENVSRTELHRGTRRWEEQNGVTFVLAIIGKMCGR
jgi:hypothetical protein